MAVRESRNNNNNKQLEGFNINSNMLYGLNGEDSIGLEIDERKRRRGDPTTNGIIDIDMGLNVTRSQVLLHYT